MGEQWYSNKDLYEMMVDLSKGLEQTNAELLKTQTMIRDYNGLREEVGEYRKEVAENCKAIAEIRTERKTTLTMWGVITGGILFIFSLLTYVNIK